MEINEHLNEAGSRWPSCAGSRECAHRKALTFLFGWRETTIIPHLDPIFTHGPHPGFTARRRSRCEGHLKTGCLADMMIPDGYIAVDGMALASSGSSWMQPISFHHVAYCTCHMALQIFGFLKVPALCSYAQASRAFDEGRWHPDSSGKLELRWPEQRPQSSR